MKGRGKSGTECSISRDVFPSTMVGEDAITPLAIHDKGKETPRLQCVVATLTGGAVRAAPACFVH